MLSSYEKKFLLCSLVSPNRSASKLSLASILGLGFKVCDLLLNYSEL